MTHIRPTFLVSAIVGSGVFFLIGPWLSDVLIEYGFEIFSSSVNQDMAIFAAAAISFPAGAFLELLPVSRSWLTLNGAFWGISCHVIWTYAALIRRKQDDSRA